MALFILKRLTEYEKPLSLHRVFHSIRFKVNKGWGKALPLFLCPFGNGLLLPPPQWIFWVSIKLSYLIISKRLQMMRILLDIAIIYYYNCDFKFSSPIIRTIFSDTFSNYLIAKLVDSDRMYPQSSPLLLATLTLLFHKIL